METSFALTEEMKEEFKWKDAGTFEGRRKEARKRNYHFHWLLYFREKVASVKVKVDRRQ